MKRTPIHRISTALQQRKRLYAKAADEYLAAHPLCQASLLANGIPELYALANATPCQGGARIPFNGKTIFIPDSVEIHHRNKRHGVRLTDQRWFMAISRVMHDFIESNLSTARANGWLLDISANPDGMTPGGQQALTTTELFSQLAA